MPDGRHLFAIDGHRVVRYDCATGGEPVAGLPLPIDTDPRVLACHPGGRVLATVEGGRAVAFRDAETLRVVRTYDFGTPTVTCVAFTPDGTRCVVGNSRGKVLLFDVDE